MAFHLVYGYVVGAIFAPFSLVVLFMLYLKRHNNLIIARNPTLLILQGCGYSMIITSSAFYTGLRNDFNCSALTIIQWITFTFVFYPFILRMWEYCASFHVATSRTKMDSKKILGDMDENEVIPETHTEDPKLKSWFVVHKNARNATYLVHLFFKTFWITILPVVPIVINTELNDDFKKYDTVVYGCNTYDYFIVILVIGMVISLFILIALAYMLRNSQDAFHIRHEIIAVAIWWVFAAPAVIVYNIFEIVDKYFPPAFLLCVAMMVSFIINTCYPLYLVRKDEQSRAEYYTNSDKFFESFLEKLALPHFRNEFFNFLSLQFCSENLLFYEVVTEWKAKVENKQINDDEKIVIGTSISNYFIDDAGEYQINILSSLKNKILAVIKTKEYGVDVFDGALKEVTELMYVNSYHNYLKTMESGRRVAGSSVLLKDSVA